MRLKRWILNMAIGALAIVGASLAMAQRASGPLALRTDAVSMEPSAAKGDEGTADNREAVTLKTAVELALKHSTGLAIAEADKKIADRGVAQSKYMFMPQFIVGSGLGYSHGFPLSLENLAPSLINVNSSAYVVNLAQRQFIQAARHELAAMTTMADARRAQVVFETALTYSQLDRLENSMTSLR